MALRDQLAIDGAARGDGLAQAGGAVAGHDHHGEVDALDAFTQSDSQHRAGHGAEGPVDERGGVAPDHQHAHGDGRAVDVAGQTVHGVNHMLGVGGGRADDDHQGHLHGEGQLGPHAVVPLHGQLHGAGAGKNQGGDEDDEGQDQTEHHGLGDDFICCKLELLAESPQESAFIFSLLCHFNILLFRILL